MKKLGVAVLLLLVTVMLSACTAFNDHQERHYVEANPDVMTVFVRFNSPAEFDPAILTDLEAQLRTSNSPERALEVLDVSWDGDINVLGDNVFTLQIKLANIPDQVVTVDTKPFQIIRKQTVFNPLSIMPESEHLNYLVGLPAERRHSAVSTDLIQTQSDGTYIYFWDDGREVWFTDVYPNRPLYYIITIVIVTGVSVIVYLLARYFYCKKPISSL